MKEAMEKANNFMSKRMYTEYINVKIPEVISKIQNERVTVANREKQKSWKPRNLLVRTARHSLRQITKLKEINMHQK